MEDRPEARWGTRRDQLGERIAGIRTRISELRQGQQERSHPTASTARMVEAQHHAAVSEAAAQRALAAGIDAFTRAAEAHDRLATHYEQAAASGATDQDQHRQRAADQRAAAAADRRRAGKAQALLSGRGGGLRDGG